MGVYIVGKPTRDSESKVSVVGNSVEVSCGDHGRAVVGETGSGAGAYCRTM